MGDGAGRGNLERRKTQNGGERLEEEVASDRQRAVQTAWTRRTQGNEYSRWNGAQH